MMVLHSFAAIFTQHPQFSSGFQRELNVIANISNKMRAGEEYVPVLMRCCTSLLTLRSSVFLLSSSSFSWSVEVTVRLSVIRVTCSSVDSSLSATGLSSCTLHTDTQMLFTHAYIPEEDMEFALNKITMKNIRKGFPLISQHMYT